MLLGKSKSLIHLCCLAYIYCAGFHTIETVFMVLTATRCHIRNHKIYSNKNLQNSWNNTYLAANRRSKDYVFPNERTRVLGKKVKHYFGCERWANKNSVSKYQLKLRSVYTEAIYKKSPFLRYVKLTDELLLQNTRQNVLTKRRQWLIHGPKRH